MPSVLERIGQGLVSFGSGIPQSQIDQIRAERDIAQNEATLGRQEIEANEEAVNRAQRVRELVGIIQAGGPDSEQAANELFRQNPELSDKLFQSMGATSDAQRQDASRRAFEIHNTPPEQRPAVIQRQIEDLRAQGRDPKDTESLLGLSTEQQDMALRITQAAALSAKDRGAVNRAERQLEQGERALDIQEGRLFASLSQPQKRETAKDASGILRFVDTGEPVFDSDVAGQSSAEDAVVATRNLIGQIMTHPALSRVFGPVQGSLPNLTPGAVDVQALIDQLKSNLTLDKIKNFKGAISDRDLEVAQSAATILNQDRISDETAARELRRLFQAFGGDPSVFDQPKPGTSAGRFTITELN